MTLVREHAIQAAMPNGAEKRALHHLALPPGCMSKDTCEGACNSGGNAKWCGKAGPSPAPTPTPTPPPAPTPPPSPAPTPSVDHVCNDGSSATPVEGCGYNCDDNCNCGRCNTKPGCMTVDT